MCIDVARAPGNRKYTRVRLQRGLEEQGAGEGARSGNEEKSPQAGEEGKGRAKEGKKRRKSTGEGGGGKHKRGKRASKQ